MLRRFVSLIALAGIVLLGLGIADYNQESGAKPEPDVITAADLVARGAPENLHLRVTDAAPALNEAVRLTTTKNGTTTGEDVFVPLTTAPARFGDKPVLAAVVRMKPAELPGFRGGPVQGMRVKAFGGLNSKVADRFAATYGKEAVDKALFLQYNRKPAGLGTAFALIGAGVVALAAAIIIKLQKPAAPPPLAVPPAPPPVPYPPPPRPR